MTNRLKNGRRDVEIVELLGSQAEIESLKQELPYFRTLALTTRQLCDAELLMNGAFSPLTGFMDREDYVSCLENMRLKSNAVWPMPITLDVDKDFATATEKGEQIALLDNEGTPIAVLLVNDIWEIDKRYEAEQLFKTTSEYHPGVHYLNHGMKTHYIGGEIKGLCLPAHYDYTQYRLTPRELREHFAHQGWKKIVAFQTRNPMHRAHFELTLQASRGLEANLLIQPVVGMTKPGDIDYFTRVKCYEKTLSHYPEQTTMLNLLPLAMRMGGPKEALWHALIRKNYGCTHFIIGRDHAGPGKDESGEAFYDPYAAQALVNTFSDEIGIEIVPFQEMVFVEELNQYLPVDKVKPGSKTLSISGTEFRRRLKENIEIPTWFSFPEVIQALRKSYPPRVKQGFTIFFTGLSGSGKSTLANALMIKLMEIGSRKATLLDGDIVRKNLSSELGFSKEHRDINIRRIGFVANEITKHGGIAICAPIAPYEKIREALRASISEHGGFIEIYLSTPLAICEQRDKKGLYKKAREGLIKGFTGIDDPYQVPENPELNFDTSKMSQQECVQQIILKLESLGYLG